MKREITLLILGMVMSCVLAACGNANTGKDETEEAKTSEVVEEVEINKDILAVAEENAQFDNEAIMKKIPTLFERVFDTYIVSVWMI